MNEFQKYEPVTITDTQSPFYLWAGTVEKVVCLWADAEGKPTAAADGEELVRYVVKASYRGLGIYGTLLLSMRGSQLAKGLPPEE